VRIIALEEHYATSAVREAWSKLASGDQDDSTKMFAGTEVDQ